MFAAVQRTRRALIPLTVGLSLAALSGCGGRPFGIRDPEGPQLDPVKVAELQPGCYCEIDMVVPPTAPSGSFDCFKGTVKEVNHDEVVLVNAIEESCIEYGTQSRPKANQQKRELVRVPLPGVDAIWALPIDKRLPPPAPAAYPMPSGGPGPMPLQGPDTARFDVPGQSAR
jgi:hypothetical protein